MPILEFSNVSMSYVRGSQRSREGRRFALSDISFSVERGSFAVVIGPSGAGKSSVLKLVLAMQRPDEGTIRVADRDIGRLRRGSIPYLRRNVGAVFQDFKLLIEASAIENVSLALHALGLPRRQVYERAAMALEQVDLEPTTRRPVRCLSGGEQQRVAIARALAGEPAMLLADEPTGNLDPRLTQEILDLLANVCSRGTTVMLATHDPLVRDHARVDQELRLMGGRLVYDSEAARRKREASDVAANALVEAVA